VDPVTDKEVIDTELQLKDLESIDKKIQKVQKVAKVGDATAKKELASLEKIKTEVESGKNVRGIDLTDDDLAVIEDLQLLTVKPVIYVANVEEESLHEDNQHVKALKESVAHENAQVIRVSAALESQIAELEQEEREMFLEEYGLAEPGLHKLIRASYDILNLITYFTAGKKEVRAWTIRKGWKAPQAAGVIHTDFERGFIRAEVIKLDDYQHYKTEAAIKEAGKMGVEGKEYIVKDGDIMHFRFNV
jgi:GTP-binding protein YchF